MGREMDGYINEQVDRKSATKTDATDGWMDGHRDIYIGKDEHKKGMSTVCQQF